MAEVSAQCLPESARWMKRWRDGRMAGKMCKGRGGVDISGESCRDQLDVSKSV